VFGTKVVPVAFPQITEAYQKADRAQARQWAEKWIREAKRVVEPSPEEIERSGTMYLAMRSLMEKHHAQAIAINCLGGFYGGHMPAYPCLGHFQLNNDGLVGACEADQQSALTMLLMGYLVGRPGYISDPVVDTATNQVIYLHCVAPSKVFGPGGPANPYEIRSHAEDRKGASLRSLMPPGQMTTTIQFAPARREVILHQAKTTGNVDDPKDYPKSCRTKLVAEIQGDVNKLLSHWDLWGWHRVTFYGDHKRAVEQITALAGFKLIEEA
jgi:L-fucose isomerase-like protein